MDITKKFFKIFLCLILAMSLITPLTADAASISDVKTNNTKYNAIKWVVDNDLIKTFTGGKFKPQDLITEAQLLTAFAKVDENYQLSYKPDVIYNFYGELNIPLHGSIETKLRNSSITRGDFARMYAAFQGLDLLQPQAVQYLYINGITNGTTGKKTYSDYKPSTKLTRGDAAVFLYRIAKSGGMTVEGLSSAATGKDNAKITLPTNFLTTGQTVNFENSTTTKNDPSNSNSTDPVQKITISKEELNANGVDSSLITVFLKDSFGKPIENDQSLQFKVKSKAGASISSSSNNVANVVYSDGGMLRVKVTAPKSTQSVKDTITFELVNNNDKNLASYQNKKFEVNLRYVPKAELRVSYEVYDPDQVDKESGNIKTPGKPIVLPEGYSAGDDINIDVVTLDTEEKTFSAVKRDSEIEYEYVELRYENQPITIWLFEEIITEYKEIKVRYTLNSEGRAVFDIRKTSDSNEAAKQAAIDELTEYLPAEKNLSMIHYDSVKAILAIYNSLSKASQEYFKTNYKDSMSKLEAANEAVDELKEKDRLDDVPDEIERYTKIIVSLVAPGGKIITDYQGGADIQFNGQTIYSVPFNTNTRDYNKNTGHAGAAVEYFDSIVYGESDVTVKLSSYDSRYEKLIKELYNNQVKTTIFTNPKFNGKACPEKSNALTEEEVEPEVAYVIDQSTSLQTINTDKYIEDKTKELLQHIEAVNNIAVTFGTSGNVEKTGTIEAFGSMDNLFKVNHSTSATDISKGINLALAKFTNSKDTTKSIVLISDGNTTEKQIQQVIEKAKAQNVKIYAVAFGEKTQINPTIMAKLAKETGGQFFHAANKTQLHDAYQSISDYILCGDTKHVNDKTVFNNAKVIIRKTMVTMTANVNTNRTDVSKVVVRFTSKNGDLQFDLLSRGSNIFSLSRPVTQFQDFDVYDDIEFLAYDEAGILIGSTSVTISQ